MASDAVSYDRISRVVGYKITKGNFSVVSPNLPQSIAIFAEANDANQSTLVPNVPKSLTSAQQAGNLYGFGSPIYNIMRILKPITGGDGVGGIPITVFPIAAANGAAAKVMKISASGVCTQNFTHKLYIAGRTGVDGTFYDINLVVGDNAVTIAQKIANAVNAVLGSPVLAFNSGYDCILTAKWKGLTSNDLNLYIDQLDNPAGITYTLQQSVAAGSGTPSIATALANLGNVWYTIIVNSFGLVSTILDSFEATNGIADPNTPTGRYASLIIKPFIAIGGSNLDDPSSITDARSLNMTNAVAPCPLSAGLQMEAAANMAYLFSLVAQNNPNLDVAGQFYPDMPMPVPLSGGIGSQATYTNRDAIVKKGCSTVDLNQGKYMMMDFVTTYHPVGEVVPQFRYCRNLNVDWNVRYAYYLLEQIHVVDHSISADTDVVNAQRTIKPKVWTGILYALADDLASRALIVNPSFMQGSIVVNLSSSNPDRLETFFRYKRSGFGRVLSTTAEAGFNFGTV